MVTTSTSCPFFHAPNKPRLQQSEGSDFNLGIGMLSLNAMKKYSSCNAHQI
jgi:hypothetical protein